MPTPDVWRRRPPRSFHQAAERGLSALGLIVPFEPEREHVTVSFRAKQLIVLATDAVLDAVDVTEHDPGAVAARLVDARVLPGCYRPRYDAPFLQCFHNVAELTRNSLVGDLPHLATTAEQLAALAIFRECRTMLAGPDRVQQSAAIDADLAEQLDVNAAHVAGELDALFATVVEDTDALALFDLPADCEPDDLGRLEVRESRALLRFDNWLVPFGNPPRPHITYDGRAWPTEL